MKRKNMSNLKFKNVEYSFVNVESEMPKYLADKIKTNFLVANHCLNNSYKTAKQNKEIKMVEGFLITNYQDGTIESVGHVWNKFEGKYFDLSKDLISPKKEIQSFEYFVADEYCSNNVSTEEKLKPSTDLYSTEKEPHIAYKTNVRNIEIELKEFLNKK